jgi:hypothetical protein
MAHANLVNTELSTQQVLRFIVALDSRSAADFTECMRSCAPGYALDAFEKIEQDRESERSLLSVWQALKVARQVRLNIEAEQTEKAKCEDPSVVEPPQSKKPR